MFHVHQNRIFGQDWTTSAMKRTILIVDAYSTGRYLAGRLHYLAPHHEIIHVQSSERLPNEFIDDFTEADFDRDLGIFQDVHALERAIGPNSVEHVIPGSEPGVELADQLATRWKCQSRNRSTLARSRRHKYYMQERVKEFGREESASQLVGSLEQARAVLLDGRLSFPVVIKPPKSAGTDGVSVCRNFDALEDAVRGLLHFRDKLGNLNDELVMQEFLYGEEYCVSGISANGVHYFTDVWKYHKKTVGRASIYECDELLAATDPCLIDILTYTQDVLTSVGIMFGPSHTELMLTEKGPRLIEVASRLQGGIDPLAMESALRCDPISLAAKSFVAPEEVRAMEWSEINSLRIWPQSKSLLCVHFVSDVEGYFDAKHVVNFLRALPTYFGESMHPSADKKTRVRPTRDLFSSPGFCYLLADQKDSMWRDYAALRVEEHVSFYKPNIDC
jgi:biotin carboxylase